jgi:3-isopropylmalate dehydrogenase
MPSASLGTGQNKLGYPRGLYEPIHGSAPDIAGQGLANPIGTLLSAAMMLRHSFGLMDEAKAIETAVQTTLADGYRTADLAPHGHPALNTEQITTEIASRIAEK